MMFVNKHESEILNKQMKITCDFNKNISDKDSIISNKLYVHTSVKTYYS